MPDNETKAELRTQVLVQWTDQYALPRSQFNEQYFSIYCKRLETLRPILEKAASAKWKEYDIKILQRAITLRPEQSAIMIGTVVKELKLLPTVLEQYAKQRAVVPIPEKTKFLNEDDKVWLEDDSGRILLQPAGGNWKDLSFDIHSLPHGSVVAARGTEAEGLFRVEDICLPGLPPQPQKLSAPTNGHRFIAIISGLAGAPSLSKELMLSYLTTTLGSELDQQELQQIVQVYVAGNFFPVQMNTERALLRKQLGAQNQQSADKQEYLRLLHEFDVDMAELTASVEVAVMPGGRDPTNFTLPHQPLNACLFPLASKFSSFQLTTAPLASRIQNTSVLGSSGEELTNLAQFVDLQDPVEVAYQLLCLRHTAPTAPHTLPAYPANTGIILYFTFVDHPKTDTCWACQWIRSC